MQTTQINVSAESRSVKFTYNNDIRRFTMKPETTLAEMVSIIRSLIQIEEAPLVIKYLDDENEWVTLEKDLEYETALLVGGHPIKLAVSLCDQRPCYREKKWKKGGKRGGKKGGRGKKACGRGKRGKRFDKARRADDDVSEKSDLADAETETSSEPKSEWKGRRGGRGKRFQKDEASEHHSDVETETSSEPKWKGRRGGRGRGRKHWKHADEHSEKSETSTSVESSLNPEEVKSKINSLFEQKKVVFERLKEAKEKLNLKKQAIKECRQVPERKEEIPALRVDLIEAKKAKFAVWDELFAIKTEIRELKASLKVKASGVQTE
jgi:hypothetical protein